MIMVADVRHRPRDAVLEWHWNGILVQVAPSVPHGAVYAEASREVDGAHGRRHPPHAGPTQTRLVPPVPQRREVTYPVVVYHCFSYMVMFLLIRLSLLFEQQVPQRRATRQDAPAHARRTPIECHAMNPLCVYTLCTITLCSSWCRHSVICFLS
jgi:hypothetical protein